MKKNLLLSLLILGIGGFISAQDIDSDLVFYLSMNSSLIQTNDAGDTIVIDSINQDVQGLIVGDVITGQRGYGDEEEGALLFGSVGMGTIEFVDTDIEGLPVADQERTYAVWIKGTDTDSESDIMSYGTTANGQHVHINVRAAEGKLRFGTWYGDYDVTAENLSDGDWHHIAITIDDAGCTVYIDGYPTEEETMDLVTDNPLNTTLSGKLVIGARNHNSGGNWNGLIDEVRIYSRALSYDDAIELSSYVPGAVVGIKTMEENQTLVVYPTIAKEILTLKSDLKINSVDIIDITGKLVKSVVLNTDNNVQVSELSNGLYIIRANSVNGTLVSKFIKR